MEKDMTSGSPLKLIFWFSIPVLLGNIFQQFYNMADAIIVGRLLGEDALAAVGATGSIMFLVLYFAIGIAQGFGVMIAQAYGAKNERLLKHYVALSILLTLIISVAVTAITVPTSRLMLTAMQTPANILDMADSYVKIIFWGIIATMFYNAASSILRGIGDSKTPLYFLVFSSLLNIILDYCFIRFFHMGTDGAAYATVLAQGISAVLCFAYMFWRFKILRTHRSDYYFDKQGVWDLMRIGLPMALNFSITAVGTMILQSAVNAFGSSVVASFTAAMKVEQLSTQPMPTLSTTMSTYCGQNLGAGKLDRVTKGMVQCSFVAAGYSVVAAVVMILFGKSFALLFVDSTEVEIIANVAKLLIINSLFFIPLALVNIIRFAIQGLGFGKLAIFAGVAEMVGRSIVGFGFVARFGFGAACLASPIAWILADIFLIPAYAYCIRKLRPIIQEKKE